MDEKVVLREAAVALREGRKAGARRVLKPLLKSNASADAWFLAANASENKSQAINCLKKALEIDQWHERANRMLLKLEGAPSLDDLPPRGEPQAEPTNAPLPELKRNLRHQKDTRQARRRIWNRVGCFSVVILMFGCSTFTFSVLGVIPGAIGAFIQFTGGPEPIVSLDGIPVQDVQNAALFIEPMVSEEIDGQSVNVLDHGYVHEYSFYARSGDEYAIYVQFVSLDMSGVDANTIVLDPDGNRIEITI